MRRDIKAPLAAVREERVRRDAGVAKLAAMTPAQIEAWIDATDPKVVLKTLAKAIFLRTRNGA